jgi:hypothetical protein
MTKKITGKEDLTSRLKNYNLRNRAQTGKTVNEVMQQTKKDQTLLVKNCSIIVEDKQAIQINQTSFLPLPMSLPQQQVQPSLPVLSNVIINNDILSGMNDMNVDEEPKDSDMMLTDDIISFKPPSEVVFNPRPQLCEEYIPEIFEHLKEIEFDFLPSPSYMKNQTDINEKMRGILIDWLVEVHLKFKLLPETLFLTVNLIDRYLEIRHIMRNRLQLVGVTAMLIACKYEEIYAPEVRDFVYITDKAYTKEEILQMENEMLAALNYNVTVPSSFRYLEVYNYFLKLDESAFMFCRYLLELFLVDYKMLKFNPSLLASSTLYITLKITKKDEVEKITELTTYSEEKLKDAAKEVCLILDNVEKSTLQAVKKKFSLAKFLEVAKIKFN